MNGAFGFLYRFIFAIDMMVQQQNAQFPPEKPRQPQRRNFDQVFMLDGGR